MFTVCIMQSRLSQDEIRDGNLLNILSVVQHLVLLLLAKRSYRRKYVIVRDHKYKFTHTDRLVGLGVSMPDY